MKTISANEIKIWLLNWLLPRLSADDIIGAEVRFLDSSSRADLVLATPTALIGFEIKGPQDSLRRLTRQAKAYDSMFHASYIVCRESDFAIGLLPKKMGIIGIEPSPNIIREPRARKLLVKANAANWLLRKDLEGLLGTRNKDIETLRAQAGGSLSAETLNDFAVRAVRQRMSGKHFAFMSELGRVVTHDDLLNLESEPRKILFP